MDIKNDPLAGANASAERLAKTVGDAVENADKSKILDKTAIDADLKDVQKVLDAQSKEIVSAARGMFKNIAAQIAGLQQSDVFKSVSVEVGAVPEFKKFSGQLQDLKDRIKAVVYENKKLTKTEMKSLLEDTKNFKQNIKNLKAAGEKNDLLKKGIKKVEEELKNPLEVELDFEGEMIKATKKAGLLKTAEYTKRMIDLKEEIATSEGVQDSLNAGFQAVVAAAGAGPIVGALDALGLGFGKTVSEKFKKHFSDLKEKQAEVLEDGLHHIETGSSEDSKDLASGILKSGNKTELIIAETGQKTYTEVKEVKKGVHATNAILLGDKDKASDLLKSVDSVKEQTSGLLIIDTTFKDIAQSQRETATNTAKTAESAQATAVETSNLKASSEEGTGKLRKSFRWLGGLFKGGLGSLAGGGLLGGIGDIVTGNLVSGVVGKALSKVPIVGKLFSGAGSVAGGAAGSTGGSLLGRMVGGLRGGLGKSIGLLDKGAGAVGRLAGPTVGKVAGQAFSKGLPIAMMAANLYGAVKGVTASYEELGDNAKRLEDMSLGDKVVEGFTSPIQAGENIGQALQHIGGIFSAHADALSQSVAEEANWQKLKVKITKEEERDLQDKIIAFKKASQARKMSDKELEDEAKNRLKMKRIVQTPEELRREQLAVKKESQVLSRKEAEELARLEGVKGETQIKKAVDTYEAAVIAAGKTLATEPVTAAEMPVSPVPQTEVQVKAVSDAKEIAVAIGKSSDAISTSAGELKTAVNPTLATVAGQVQTGITKSEAIAARVDSGLTSVASAPDRDLERIKELMGSPKKIVRQGTDTMVSNVRQPLDEVRSTIESQSSMMQTTMNALIKAVTQAKPNTTGHAIMGPDIKSIPVIVQDMGLILANSGLV